MSLSTSYEKNKETYWIWADNIESEGSSAEWFEREGIVGQKKDEEVSSGNSDDEGGVGRMKAGCIELCFSGKAGRVESEKEKLFDDVEEKQFKDMDNLCISVTCVRVKSDDIVLADGQSRNVDRKEDKGGDEVEKVNNNMTEREIRVSTGHNYRAGQKRPAEDGDGSSALISLHKKRKKKVELPDLIHNLNLLVDMTELEINAADLKLEALEIEGEKLSNMVEKEKQQIETVEKIIDVFDKLEEKHKYCELNQEV